jgi:hypothetical protein
MAFMSETLIIGAGIVGLTVAKQLSVRGIPANGVEAQSKLGGRLEFGHQRIYTGEAKDLLTDVLPGLEWTTISEDASQIKKGEWAPLTEELSAPEQFYTGKTFFHPQATYSELVARLAAEVGSTFQLRTEVTKIDLDRKVAHCLNGSEIAFSHLVWTSSLASLSKITGQTPRGISKKKIKPIETGGITWDIKVSNPLFTQANTLVFPFRYKDLKVRALGMRATWAPEHPETYHWIVFLEDAQLENREELAKIVRAFKRELTKQFPLLEGAIISERLAFHPSLSGETPVPVASLEVFDGVVCLGPDVQTEEVSPESDRHSRRNLDVVLRNTLDFVDLILPKWLETPRPSAPAEPESTVSA